jgi:hypothetical protein
LLTGIVGVPWQLVARGGEVSNGAMTGSDLADSGGWIALVGDPSSNVPPTDPHMIESIEPRNGVPPPGSAPDADAYIGHDYSVPLRDALQYACLWDLGDIERDCTGQQNCLCSDPENDNPACEEGPGGFRTTQIAAVATPGTRPLLLLQALGHRAVVGSVCPALISDEDSPDYGFKYVFDTLTQLTAERLAF